jgi:alpha-tubulin suppressor-like RCC1 family protein
VLFRSRCTPVTTFAGGTDWKQVSCGGSHTAAIKTDGTLWVWGRGDSGQLGNGVTTGNISTPVTTFSGGTNWKEVSSGGYHTAAIKTDGTLWVWGSNSNGQLGINATTVRCTPVTTFAGGTNWKEVSCGVNYTSGIKTDGTLWVWGVNFNGGLGINATGDRCTPVTTFAGGTNWKQLGLFGPVTGFTGGPYMSAIKTDGTLWLWGGNTNGQLGINDTTNRCTPVTTFAGGTNWKQVSNTGTSFSGVTVAIKTDGTLWTWGYNNKGALGTNNTITRSTPVTTFAGGTNWKQCRTNGSMSAAIR